MHLHVRFPLKPDYEVLFICFCDFDTLTFGLITKACGGQQTSWQCGEVL